MDKKKKPFVKPELREEASLAEVTLQSGNVIPCDQLPIDDDRYCGGVPL